MAWMVGEMIQEIKKHGLQQRTLVLFVNDHGPGNWGCAPSHSAGAFRGDGGGTWEAASRGPAIAWWPGKIKRGTITSSIISAMDILPTALSVAGRQSIVIYVLM